MTRQGSSDAAPSGVSDDATLDESLRALANTLFSEQTPEETLDSIAQLARRTIPGCDTASVTVMEEGRPRTSVSTSHVALAIDKEQYGADDGPCLEAVRQRRVVRVDTLAEEDRWPEVVRAARAHGISSSLSLPLIAGDDAVGALNLYSNADGGFLDAESVGGVFASHAAITLANARALHRATELAQNLSVALENRDTIGQAKGILMAQRGISADEAFDVLRRASQRINRKLYDLAVEVVRQGSGDELDG